MPTRLAVPPAARRLYERVASARIALPLSALNLAVALWMLAALNGPFWRALWTASGGWNSAHAGFLLSLPVFVVLWVWLVLEVLTWGRAAKPMLALLLVLSATLAYFMRIYAVVFDEGMLTNMVQTDPREIRDLLSPSLVVWVVGLGIVPAWLLTRVTVRRRRWYAHLLGKATTIAAILCGLAVAAAPFIQSYAPLLRNHRELRLQLVPTNYLAAIHSYGKARIAQLRPVKVTQIAATRDAVASAKPTLTLLLIGETARAANWGLNGYERQTTPRLAADAEVINFEDVRSCGTATAVSLPCMFLDVGRDGFGHGLAARRENLLDVLHNAGLDVLWRDNNSGCKGLCDRVPLEDLTVAKVPGLCDHGECYDEILLHGLQEKVDTLTRDTVIVLHMQGSHGPAYYLRYPAAFESYKPACQTNAFDRCERSEIVNAYDNTLRYTDHVLGLTLEFLRRNAQRVDATLIYVSDHGESLGERGLYLHGLPYALAPAEQTRVPMVMWLSSGARERFGISAACLNDKRGKPLSHDNLYHSVVGLLRVHTEVYRPERDIFRDCRSADASVAFKKS